jgi:hypothetical protein
MQRKTKVVHWGVFMDATVLVRPDRRNESLGKISADEHPTWQASEQQLNVADRISDIEGKATRVGASERGQRTSFKWAGAHESMRATSEFQMPQSSPAATVVSVMPRERK